MKNMLWVKISISTHILNYLTTICFRYVHLELALEENLKKRELYKKIIVFLNHCNYDIN